MSLPEKYGRYRVVERLGAGSMASVYLAEDPTLARRVAIKVIKASAELKGEERERLLARFVREYRVTGQLVHPNIVTVFDVAEEQGTPFIAMEHVDGPTLMSILDTEAPLPRSRIADLFVPIAQALDFAHAHGVVHRDLKPSNVILTDDGCPKITDFGLAKVASTTVLTRASAIVGTPRYMSPEQVTGHDVSGASDQFSLGTILYRAVTGERPFTGNSPTTVMYKIVHEQPLKPHFINRLLPRAVDAVILRALSKDTKERYPTCAEMVDDLLAALQGDLPEPTVAAPEPGEDERASRKGVAAPLRASEVPSNSTVRLEDLDDEGDALDEDADGEDAGGAGLLQRLGRWVRERLGDADAREHPPDASRSETLVVPVQGPAPIEGDAPARIQGDANEAATAAEHPWDAADQGPTPQRTGDADVAADTLVVRRDRRRDAGKRGGAAAEPHDEPDGRPSGEEPDAADERHSAGAPGATPPRGNGDRGAADDDGSPADADPGGEMR